MIELWRNAFLLGGKRAPYQTKREGNRVFLNQCCQNSYGMFMKLIQLGTGKGIGIIAIPKGIYGSRWDVFVKNVKSFVGSTSFVLAPENRASPFPNASSKASKGNKESHVNPGVSYLSVLKAPAQEIQKDGRSRKLPVEGNIGWYSHSLQKLGDLEGCLWQAKAEIAEWQSKLVQLLKTVDD